MDGKIMDNIYKSITIIKTLDYNLQKKRQNMNYKNKIYFRFHTFL